MLGQVIAQLEQHQKVKTKDRQLSGHIYLGHSLSFVCQFTDTHQGSYNNRNNALWNTTSIRLCFFKQVITLSKSHLKEFKSTQKNSCIEEAFMYDLH